MNKRKARIQKAESIGTTVKGKTHYLGEIEILEPNESEAYFHLGKLSAAFAEMEADVHNLLLAIAAKDEFPSRFLIERNALEKNVQLVRAVNEMVEFEPQQIEDLLKRIEAVKDERNTLIHGYWIILPDRNPEKVVISVSVNKIKRPAATDRHKNWENVTETHYDLPTLQKHIGTVQQINRELDHWVSIVRDTNEAKKEEIKERLRSQGERRAANKK